MRLLKRRCQSIEQMREVKQERVKPTPRNHIDFDHTQPHKLFEPRDDYKPEVQDVMLRVQSVDLLQPNSQKTPYETAKRTFTEMSQKELDGFTQATKSTSELFRMSTVELHQRQMTQTNYEYGHQPNAFIPTSLPKMTQFNSAQTLPEAWEINHTNKMKLSEPQSNKSNSYLNRIGTSTYNSAVKSGEGSIRDVIVEEVPESTILTEERMSF